MPVERQLYRGSLGGIGQYNASVTDPGRDHPFAWPLVVFPRTTLGIDLQVAGDRGVIGPTSAVLYRIGEVARVRWIDPEDRCDYVALAPELYEQLTATSFDRARFDRSIVPVSGPTLVVWRSLLARLARAVPPDDLEVQETTIELVVNVAAGARCTVTPRLAVSPRDRALVARAQEAIGATAAANHSVDEVARQVGASAGHLARTFRKVTGTTMHAYRTELRVRRSLDELDDDLTALALRWGFSSHSHYSERVRACLGETPSALRRRFHPDG